MTQEITGYSDEGPAAYLAHVAAERHRAVQDVARWFDYRRLPAGLPRQVSRILSVTASNMLDLIEVDDPELTRGLSRLVEAKDALVRAAIVAQGAPEPAPDLSALLARAVRELADSGSPGQNRLAAELARDGGIEL